MVSKALVIKRGCVMMKNIVIFLAILLATTQNSSAQQSSARESMDAAIEQSNGQYSEIDMPYLWSLGMQQKAWNKPMEHLGEGQSKPGYSRYFWTPDLVLPLRIREGMHTLINFPAWEFIENVFVGNESAFGVKKVTTNALMVFANNPELVGMDTNMMVFGRSGNRYVFYLRSETFNADRITNAVVDIIVNDAKYVPDDSGKTPFAAGTVGVGSQVTSMNSMGGFGSSGMGGTATKKKSEDDWLSDVEMDPEKLKFDIDVFIPNPEDMDIAPERVWRDEIFTYIDFGPKALSMVQRPVASILVDRVESPIGFRTRGPYGRLMVVEGIGDIVLRNGKKLICLKIRKDPTFGTDWTEYEKSVQRKQPAALPPAVGGPMGGAASWNGYQGNNPMMGATPMGMGGMMMGQPQMMPQSQQNFAHPYQPNNFGAKYRGAPAESIAIELGADSEIQNLEQKWDSISRKNKDLLGGFEPYYSIDTVAEGETHDVFRLRIGPVGSIKDGDTLCNKLGKRGLTCVVVRTQ